MKTSILLVHGAWQGAWVWDEVALGLTRRGFTVRAFDLPGSGDDLTPATEITLASYAQAIVAQARAMQADRLILVGHSMGGAAITAAASMAPELFDRLIYVCAFLPFSGESVGSLSAQGPMPEGGGAQMEMIGATGLARLIPERIADTFLNGCAPEVIANAVSQFRPQVLLPIVTPVTWTPGFERLAKDYIQCRNDRVLHPALQALMAERAGIVQVLSLNSGHEPFLSDPEALVALLSQRADYRE